MNVKQKADYYNQPEFWSKNFDDDPVEHKKIDDIIRVMPSEIHSLLDVGCGNGALLNKIKSSREETAPRLVGIDFSREALKYVQTRKCLGNVSSLPFRNGSFDLVVCSDVLEHLGANEFHQVVVEIPRVSRKYAMIIVPNDEDLESLLVYCPDCHCWFNNELHVRSFNFSRLSNLFVDMRLTQFMEIGTSIKTVSYGDLAKLFFIYRRRRVPADYAQCPQCGRQKKRPAQGALIKRGNGFNLARAINNIRRKIDNQIYQTIWRQKEKKTEILAVFTKISPAD